MKKVLYIDMDNVLVDFPSGIEKLDEKTKIELEHDQIIDDLEKRLEKEGMICFRNESYILRECGNENNSGEIDIYGINQDKKEIIAIEVKRSYNGKNKTKAHHQLRKDILFLVNKYFGVKIITMYAYGEVGKRRGYNIEGYIPLI